MSEPDARRPLSTHELTVLRAWTAGIHRDSRDLIERVIDEAETARFALGEIAVHLEGLEHTRKLTPLEKAILAEARAGLTAAALSAEGGRDE